MTTKQNETPRLIAERIVIQHVHPLTSTDMRALTDDIEAALNAERERCAKIAEMMAAGETYGTGRQKAINIAAVLAMPPSFGWPEVATFDGAKRIDQLLKTLADEVEELREELAERRRDILNLEDEAYRNHV